MLLIVGVAAGFRFWRLGDLPPGLYSDEAYNGLDALRVLSGQHALFFEQNNGREPLYIYMTALMVQIFGRTAFAVRFSAALLGTLTVFPTYLFSKLWFGRQIGLLTALLWAITLWPIHLSRVGFRSIGLPFFTAIFLYVASVAVQQVARNDPRAHWVSFAAGIVYAMLFYTYLAARLTPLFLIVFLIYMRWQHPKAIHWRLIGSFLGGAVVGIAPFALYTLFNWEMIFGRTGQVSIFSPSIHQGDLIGTFRRHITAAVGMFIWQGDTIVRHNPAGRPVFDLLIAFPFLLGVWQCVRRWRQPAYAATLLWVGTLLWGTILAEDAPHFLRSVGILPLLLIFPAVGLSCLSNWSKLPRSLSGSVLIILLIGSGSFTIRDYFVDYVQQVDTYYLFESAARELAEQVNFDRSLQVDSYIHTRFAQEWESIPFLITSDIQPVGPNDVVKLDLKAATSLYVWPHESTDYLQQYVQPPMRVDITTGGLVRGDLEVEPYTLYTRYVFYPDQPPRHIVANFDNQLHLHEIVLDSAEGPYLSIKLTWSFPTQPARELKAFVHVLDRATMTLVGQADGPIGGSDWLLDWWEVDVSVQEKREIQLPTRYDISDYIVLVGAYDPITLERLQRLDESGQPAGDSWEIVESE